MTAPVANPYAHIPAIPAEGQYRLGASLEPAASDVMINTTLPDGTCLVIEEPEGWEGIQFITPIDQAGGRDGGLLGPQSVAVRELRCVGAMVAPTAQVLRQRIRQMRAMLGPRKQVVWEQYDFGVLVRMGMVCRAQGDFNATPVMGHQYGGVATRIQFTLVASTPWKYATGTANQSCMGLPVSAVTGRTYNKTYSWNYGATTNPGGFMNVVNAGDIEAWPVITVTGPVDNPVISNESTGASFTLTSVVPAGQTVTIDSRTGNISPSSYRIVGRPFPLRPGNNTIRWRATSGTFTPDASLCVAWRSTWE